jgi:hypothetical protein
LLLIATLLAGCDSVPAAQLGPPIPVEQSPSYLADDPPHPIPSPVAGPPIATLPPPAGARTPVPTISPITSGFLIYTESDGSLWRADRPGIPLRQLAPPSADGTTPSWAASPDGTTIAVISSAYVYPAQQHNGTSVATLWLISTDGSGAHKVLDLLAPALALQPSDLLEFDLLPPTIAAQTPVWSPNGTSVAFVSAHTGTVDLYTASRGGALARLTDTPQVERAPLWSPDSALVAYTSANTLDPGSSFGLAISQRAGGAPIFERTPLQLTNGEVASGISGRTWIDSRTLALGLLRGPLCGGEVQVLDIVAATTTSVLQRSEACVGPPIWGAGAGMLAISVGGNSSESIGLYRWAPGDRQAARIAPGPPLEMAWNPAGDTLAYRLPSATGDRSDIVLWRAGAEPISIAQASWPPRWSVDGSLLALGATIVDPDGQSLATLPDPWASPLGWGAYGLYYTVGRANPPNTLELWLWDGQATRQIHTLRDDHGYMTVVAGGFHARRAS